MLLTIEKVAILESVDIFGDTPDYILASIAAIIEEVNLSPGENIIEEGAIGRRQTNRETHSPATSSS